MFLIIWGFRVRFQTTDEGDFFCPKDGGDRRYARRTARRWFTIFWIPLIPLKEVGQIIECQSCHTRFNESVLTTPTTTALSGMLANAVRVVTAVLVKLGDPSDPGLRAAAVSEVRSTGGQYDEATLDADVQVVDPATVPAYVEPLANGLETSGKERFVADLVRVAHAGSPTEPQRQLVELVGRSLGLTAAHVAGIVGTATQSGMEGFTLPDVEHPTAASGPMAAPPASGAPPSAPPPTADPGSAPPSGPTA